MPHPPYPNHDQLYGTMISFGEYQLLYLPPERGIEGRITMSISAEANLDQMLEIFSNFLRASGYCIAPFATLEINENEPEKPFQDRIESAWANHPTFTSNDTWYGGYRHSKASDDTINS